MMRMRKIRNFQNQSGQTSEFVCHFLNWDHIKFMDSFRKSKAWSL